MSKNPNHAKFHIPGYRQYDYKCEICDQPVCNDYNKKLGMSCRLLTGHEPDHAMHLHTWEK